MSNYHESFDLQNELHCVMEEVRIEFNLLEDDAYCVAARRYLMNHWFRFERFGVTSREEMDPVVVTIKRGKPAPEDMPPYSDLWGDTGKTVSTSVSLSGTPLAGKL